MNHFFKPVQGFLLIEFVTALALIGLLVTFISLFLAKGIETQHDTSMRLQALDVATTTVERLRLGLPIQKKIPQFVVTVHSADVGIDHGKIDVLIPVLANSVRDDHKPQTLPLHTNWPQAYIVTVAWKSCAGTQRLVRLMTVFDADVVQGAL